MSQITIRYGAPEPRWSVLRTTLAGGVALVVAGVGTAVLFHLSSAPWPILAGAIAYLLISYVVIPQPDTDDLGLCGYWWNDLSSFSDNINRGVLRWMIMLLPGRLIAESLVRLLLLGLGLVTGSDGRDGARE
ncbi:MAG: hypothetical protein KDA25_02130 [Phycisphaerales bacterium]|nr:hypothetical protein [Phycisphaerales bacterium]